MSTPPLRLVVVGCGRVFQRYHLSAIRATPAVRLVGACEIDPARRAWADTAIAGDGRTVPCVEHLDELLRSAEADAALVATPPGTHSALATALLERGLHVLVEKPMALTLVDARRLAATRRAAERVLRIGFNRRYRADYARLRQGVRSIRQVDFTFLSESGRWVAGAVPVEEVLHDFGSHAVDLVAHVGGAPIERVRVDQERRENGDVVRLEAALRNGVGAACVVGSSPRYEEHLTVTGGGSAPGDLTSRRAWASTARFGQVRLAWCRLTGRPTPADRSFRLQLLAFASACSGRPDDTGADVGAGLHSVAAVEACLHSLGRAGQWCDVAPIS